MTPSQPTQPTFLYVEDDEFSREITRLLLIDVMGFSQLTLFADSADFLARLQALSYIPSVIFLDIQMGPPDGYQMLALIRSDPAYRDSRVIAMTANVMAHDVERLQQVGFDGLIGKPLRKKLFPQMIERILAGEKIWFVP
jgi:two-component system cell cycle response regulator DivK